MKRRQKDQPVPSTRRDLMFNNGNGHLTFTTHTSLSAYEFVRDVLTVTTTIFKAGKRLVYNRPLYIPANLNIHRELRNSKLKEYKAETKKMCGINYRPTSLGILSDGMLIAKH